MASRRIAGPNGDLVVDDRGADGTPVLFVHGNGGSSKLWRAQLGHLARTRRALAVDLHGFGRSHATAIAPYSLDSFAADLDAVIRGLEIGRLILVGHSLGGAVAARFAVAHDECVSGAVYVDCVGDTRMPAVVAASMGAELRSRSDPDRATAWFEGLLVDARDETRELVLAELARASRDAVAGSFLALTRVDPSRWVAGFRGPALHLFVPMFNRGPTSLVELLPSLPSIAMTGVSHWPMIDSPGVFNRHLDSFLQRVDSTTAAGVRST